MDRVIEWTGTSVRFLDQTKLPGKEIHRETEDPAVLAEAIRTLAIRGAPLIGVAAAYGVALAVHHLRDEEDSSRNSHLARAVTLFASTRPTAVNLFRSLERMQVAARRAGSLSELRHILEHEALAIHEEERAMCENIAEAGAGELPNAASVLTHCNTGALATGGLGTALGVIRRAWELHKLRSVSVTETRPLFQGARLTVWELQKLHIPVTLITDSTAGFLMQQGRINAVVVGADRIAGNGDAANKIGTYGLAVLARYHQVPFYVAAPWSTVDMATPGGTLIEIEERSGREVTEVGGVSIAPEGTEVYSPAFDITPHGLITAFFTDRGVVRPPYAVNFGKLHSRRVTA